MKTRFLMMLLSPLVMFSIKLRAENPSLDAKQLILKAKAFMEDTNYKTVLKNQKLMFEKEGEKIIYHVRGTEGTSLYKCIHLFNGKEIGYILQNKNGVYAFVIKPDGEKKIYKYEDFHKDWTTIAMMQKPFITLEQDLNSKNAYQVKEIKYMNIPCYEITMKGEFPDDATLAEHINWTVERVKANKEKLIEHYPTVRKFIIGIKKPYIYQISIYTSRGRKICTIDYGIPDFKANIDMKMFKTPSGPIETLYPRKNIKK